MELMGDGESGVALSPRAPRLAVSALPFWQAVVSSHRTSVSRLVNSQMLQHGWSNDQAAAAGSPVSSQRSQRDGQAARDL